MHVVYASEGDTEWFDSIAADINHKTGALLERGMCQSTNGTHLGTTCCVRNTPMYCCCTHLERGEALMMCSVFFNPHRVKFN